MFVSFRLSGLLPAMSAFGFSACAITTFRLAFWTFQILISGETHACSAGAQRRARTRDARSAADDEPGGQESEAPTHAFECTQRSSRVAAA